MNRIGAILAWLAAAAAATVASSVAVGAIGSGIVPRAEPPLSPDEVSRQLAELTPTSGAPPATTVPTSTSMPPPAGTTVATTRPPTQPAPEVLSSQGGTVLVRCTPGVDVLSEVPAQGYRVKDVEPEDGGVRVRFESGHTRIEVTVTCVNGKPSSSVRVN